MNDYTDIAELMEGGYFGATAYAKRHGISVERARQLAFRAWRQATSDALVMPNGARHLPDEWPLDKLPLPVRSRNVLVAEGLKTVGEVRGRTDAQLLAMPNFGEACLVWLRHVTATPGHDPVREGLELKVARLEGENSKLRIRVRRIADAVKAATEAAG